MKKVLQKVEKKDLKEENPSGNLNRCEKKALYKIQTLLRIFKNS